MLDVESDGAVALSSDDAEQHRREMGEDGIVKLAVLAVGGQGGGVLTNWIVDLAERGGWHAQATSVAGVAQRTGSTIYYVEMAPRRADEPHAPVFALAPAPGDVDILVAAELMEAGRAVMRGFVTPDRTTLVASTHRVLATVEKVVPGDGRSPSEPVIGELRAAAHHAVLGDLEAVAVAQGSVISASLFGALAASGALPFGRALYEETIRASGRGVEASLRAFRAGADGDRAPPLDTEAPSEQRLPASGAPAPEDTSLGAPRGPERLRREWDRLVARLDALPEGAREMARAGLRKVVDYQDIAYGAAYCDRLAATAQGDREGTFTHEAAKHLANAMCYEDLIRVADLKTRASRDRRLRAEQSADTDAVVGVTEYFHPRAQEMIGTMPARLGRWFEGRPRATARLDRLVNRGRRLRTDRLGGFGALWLVSALRPLRRKLLRHAQEEAHWTAWLALAERTRERDYQLGCEVLCCRRLIKGYSDTHARGLSKYDRVLSALSLLEGRDDAADWLRRLREAALKDEKGEALDGALRTVESFAA